MGFTAISIATVLRLGWPEQEFLTGAPLAVQVAGTIALGAHLTGCVRRRAKARR